MAAHESSRNGARGVFDITGISAVEEEEEEAPLVRKHLTLM